MYAGMAEGGREPRDPNRIQTLEVEVDLNNLDTAVRFLPLPPGTQWRTGGRGYIMARAVLEHQAWTQPITQKKETPRELRHLPKIGTTNGRLFLDLSRSRLDLTDLTEPPPQPPFPVAPPGILSLIHI